MEGIIGQLTGKLYLNVFFTYNLVINVASE